MRDMGGLAGYPGDRKDIRLNEAQGHKEEEEKIGLGSTGVESTQ